MILNRFAVSALSTKYKYEALPDEIMIDKLTGQIAIKTVLGDTVSFDHLSRFKDHVNMVTALAPMYNIKGIISSLQLTDENKEMPLVYTLGTNLMSIPLNLSLSSLKKLLISTDIDCLNLGQGDNMLVNIEPKVKIKLSCTHATQGTRELIVEKKLSVLNSYVINLSENILNYPMAGVTVKLSELSITADSSFNITTLRAILYSILIVTEEGVQ